MLHNILQVQLVLNAFSVGCAGFSVLTPYRAVFVGLTATSLGVSHLRHRCVMNSIHLSYSADDSGLAIASSSAAMT